MMQPRFIIAAALAVASAGLVAACSSTSSLHPAAPGTSKDTAGEIASTAGTVPTGCTPQTVTWLATPMGNGAPLSQGIRAVEFDAATYLQDWQTTGDHGAVLLNILSAEVGNLTGAALDGSPMPPVPPACTGGEGAYQLLLSNAQAAAHGTPGAPQATVDCRSVISDYTALRQFLALSAPGAKLPPKPTSS
jgi:hypothetical protein